MQPNIIILSRHTVPVRDESDVYAAVGLARKMTTEMGFAPSAQACAQTIIAELARNALRHGGGGTVELSALQSPSSGGTRSSGGSPPSGGTPSLGGQQTRRGLEIVVQDRGPGIPDVSRVLEGVGTPAQKGGAPAPQNGGARSLGSGLGVGLSSAQRLADEFSIDSVVGSGTRIRALKWDSPSPADQPRRSERGKSRRSVGAR